MQLVNSSTGEFTLDNGFIVSHKTSAKDLTAHFGESNLSARDFKNGHSNYSVRNLKVGELYFILFFYFFNEQITKIEILVQAKLYDHEPDWNNFDQDGELKRGKFIEQWMAKQMRGDHKEYAWGKMGVSYDFHNLSTSGFISYNSGSENS